MCHHNQLDKITTEIKYTVVVRKFDCFVGNHQKKYLGLLELFLCSNTLAADLNHDCVNSIHLVAECQEGDLPIPYLEIYVIVRPQN